MSEAVDFIQSVINNNVGKIISSKKFYSPDIIVSKAVVTCYISNLHTNGITEKVDYGVYKILRFIDNDERKYIMYTPNKLKEHATRIIPIRPSQGSKIRKHLKENNYDLTKRMPYGSFSTIANELGVLQSQVKSTVGYIKKKSKIVVPLSIAVKKPKVNLLAEMFKPFGMGRELPNHNRAASDKIIYALENILPKGGGGLFLGTPTPFATSNHPKNNMFLLDELEVASILKLKCETPPVILIGDLVNPEKAQLKADWWKGNNITCNFEVIVGPVDRDSYNGKISEMVNESPLLKVVFMASGSWVCCKDTKKKYGQDFNFKSPSEYLYKKGRHPNLHLLAMVWNGTEFDILYLNNGNISKIKIK